MKYRTLGKTKLKVAEVGFGTWQLAGDPNAWVGSNLNESLNSLYKYVELGGNFIDTAWVYGYSDTNPDRHPSEELVGRFIKEFGKREDLIIATKVPPKNWNWPAHRGIPISEVFPNDHIEQYVDDSLRSLGVDSIDLMQFHVWQDDFAREDGWKETIKKISDSGKVKHWGISINDYQPSNCIKTLDTGFISTIQLIFNIFHQLPVTRLFAYAKENNVGLIVRVPLDEGGLGGKFTLDTKFAPDELRSTYFGGDRLAELVSRTDELKKLLGNEAESLSELALRYILSFDEVSTVIPGMRKVPHVDSNTAVSDDRKLSAELMESLKKHNWERNFYGDGDPAMESAGFIER
ncbi:MAG: aldo/keto reductase [bacterium]|nr:aldo/keto reductase [bacterium]